MKRFHVIQGGKARTRETGARGSGPRLFRAHSISNLSKGDDVYHDVQFNWYCLEREEPSYPYSELIAGYELLDDRERRLMERDVNRFFTEEEVDALGLYLLDRFGTGLVREEVALPVKERTHLFGEGSSVVYDFMELSEREDYSLPVKVWGYYTLRNCLTSPSMEKGVRFLLEAFELMGIKPAVGRTELERVVKTLYEHKGLLVTSRKGQDEGADK